MWEDSKVKLAKVTPEETSLKLQYSYLSTWESTLYKAPITVKAPYKIGHKNFDQDERLVIYADKTNNVRKYNAFDEHNLVIDAAKVDIDNYDSILGFCNTYGLIGNEQGHRDHIFLDDFVSYIILVKRLLNLHKAIKDNNIEELERHKFEVETRLKNKKKERTDRRIKELKYALEHDNNDNLRAYRLRELAKLEEMKRHPIDIGGDMGGALTGSAEQFAKWELLSTLNFFNTPNVRPVNEDNKKYGGPALQNRNEGIFPILKLGKNGDFIPAYISRSLFSVILFRIFEFALKDKPLEWCLNCKSLFSPKVVGIKFCPSNNGKRSSCENSYNQMVYRARRSVKSGKKTIEDICKSTGRSYEEVIKWFEQ